MPRRGDVIITGGIYHVYNKTIDERLLFLKDTTCISFLDACQYYRSDKVRASFSDFLRWPQNMREDAWREYVQKKYFRVEILAYCLMPTHFHLILKQNSDGGIIKFMSDMVNSFTKNHNKKMRRIGPVFLPRFKSRVVLSDEQLTHVSRYIHLNPYSGGVVTDIAHLRQYTWSSYTAYITDEEQIFVSTDEVLNRFNGKKHMYEKFVLDNADYQRSLEDFKYTDKW